MLDGMIIVANTVMMQVEKNAYKQTMLPVFFRFRSLGAAISRYTCARVSNPLIESSECPKAMMIAIAGMVGQTVPVSHPVELWLKTKLCGSGAGGRFHWPRSRSVNGHHTSSAITITVVICMMRNAAPLDS